MTTKYKHRRNKLIKFLETVRDDKFNIDTMLVPKDATESNDCGTVSCALGWCQIIFPKSVGKMPVAISNPHAEGCTIPNFENKNNRNIAEAAADFFGISANDAWSIFYQNFSAASEKRTAIDVAKDLRNVKEIIH